jgi:hypothetical protein
MVLNPQLKELRALEVRDKLHILQQGLGSVSKLKKDFDQLLASLTALDADIIGQPALALLFIKKLRQDLYGECIQHMVRNAKAGGAFPQTLFDAFTLAESWEEDLPEKLGRKDTATDLGRLNEVFLETFNPIKRDDKFKSRKDSNKNHGRNSRDDWRTASISTRAIICDACKLEGHTWRKCPNLEEMRRQERETSKKEKGKDDRKLPGLYLTSHSKFEDTEVLLDNQASTSVFHNDALLTNLHQIEPFAIGGIDSTANSMTVSHAGDLDHLDTVGYASDAAANVLSKTRLIDAGLKITYDEPNDRYIVFGRDRRYIFGRRIHTSGDKSSHYTCDFGRKSVHNDQLVCVATVEDNSRRMTVREIQQAKAARHLQEQLGYPTTAMAIRMLNAGIINCPVTVHDMHLADSLFGPSIPGIKGRTTQHKSLPAPAAITPAVVQVEQILSVDIMFIKTIPFLLGIVMPLGFTLCAHLDNRKSSTVGAAIKSFVATLMSRNFVCSQIRSDNEGGLVTIIPQLQEAGIEVQLAGPGQSVPEIERRIRPVKERVRIFDATLPFVMPRKVLVMCVLFVVHCLNLQPSATCTDSTSPHEQFSGRKLNAAKDLRTAFGDYCQATAPATDNTMLSRTQGCIALLPHMNLTGSVAMYCIPTARIVTRDQFTVLPMPDEIVQHLNSLAAADGLRRGSEPDVLPEPSPVPAPVLPRMQSIAQLPPASPTPSAIWDELPSTPHDLEPLTAPDMSADDPAAPAPFATATPRSSHPWHGAGPNVFHVSVRAALRDRPQEAIPVIRRELQQMVDKAVWSGVHPRDLSAAHRHSILRSSMFLKDKFLASGAFEKFKARLVAGGDQQDKTLYEHLSSPTAATSSVLTIAAIAADEHRHVMTLDIGGAFLNADMSPTGVPVHMRLDPVMTAIVADIDPSFSPFVQANGTSVVRLNKALYGCVEASSLWFAHLTATLIALRFKPNAYDPCVFNKSGVSGNQVTIAVHVDDLLVTSRNPHDLDALVQALQRTYQEIQFKRDTTLDYIGMTFAFPGDGSVRVTMANSVDNILTSCGVAATYVTPATATLFDVRDVLKATTAESQWFHTHVAKFLYLAKRTRPECLTAVAFLCTRVTSCDRDDIAKLSRLLGYLRHTRDRGIVLRIGGDVTVRAYVDAAYSAHKETGRSHTGCAVVVGSAGPVYVTSTGQKIVTKSSTEAELVGLSDTASQAIHLRNFLVEQGYDMGPAILYQDNLSCMSLIDRGAPGAQGSRHIDIRYFWLNERVAANEVEIVHLGTADMFANILTKPVQGAQFIRERQGLTNWH